MKFGYLRLYTDKSGVYFRATNKNVAEWLFQETKKMIPNCKFSFYRGGNGRIYSLDGKDFEVGIQLLQNLLDNGWEPFSIEHDDHSSFDSSDNIRRTGTAVYHLRKKYSDDSSKE